MVQIDKKDRRGVRIDRARIKINGETVLRALRFNRWNDRIEKEVYLNKGVNEIEVIMFGKPGGEVHVSVLQDVEADAAASIGSEGGEIATDDDTIKLFISKNSVTKPTIFSINSDPVIYTYPELEGVGFVAVVPKISLEPSGIIFNEPILIKVKYDETLLYGVNDEKKLRFIRLKDPIENSDDLIGVIVDTEKNVITAPLNHFSDYVVTTAPDELVYGFKWGVEKIYYFVEEDNNGWLWGQDHYLKSVVRDAVESWEEKQSEFDLIDTTDRNKANIIIRTQDSVFGGYARANILHLKFTNKKLYSDDTITIDIESSESAYQNYYSYDQDKGIETIIRHEVGHTLGLAHNNSSESTKTPVGVPAMWVAGLFGDPFLEFDRKITGDDIAAIQYKYGSFDESWEIDGLDNSKWYSYLYGEGATVTIGDKDVTLETSDNLGGQATLISDYDLEGDFDIQVDFDITDWPAQANKHDVQLDFQIGYGGPNDRILIGIAPSGGQPSKYYFAWMQKDQVGYEGDHVVMTEDNDGKFRIQRVGSVTKIILLELGTRCVGITTNFQP